MMGIAWVVSSPRKQAASSKALIPSMASLISTRSGQAPVVIRSSASSPLGDVSINTSLAPKISAMESSSCCESSAPTTRTLLLIRPLLLALAALSSRSSSVQLS